jgi:hypothetical protein
MNLEQVAAHAFFTELEKIALTEGVDAGTKTAAMNLWGALDEESAIEFLKQAGFGSMLAGVGRGVGALGMGALKGAGGVVAGAARGVGGAVANAAGRVGGALKAAPGAIGAKMTALGQRAEQGMAGMGAKLQAAGQAKGQAIQGRLAGPNASSAMNDIAMHQQANPVATMPSPEQKQQALSNIAGNRESPGMKPAMLSAGWQLAASNPMHGLGSSLVSGVKGMLAPSPGRAQPPPLPARAQGPSYGALAPAM